MREGDRNVLVGCAVRHVLRWALVLGGTAILLATVLELLSAETRSDTVTVALLGLGALLIVFGASGARIASFEGPGGWKASLTTSNGALSRSAQTIAVAQAFAADSTLPPVVRAEALQVVAGVARASAYENLVRQCLVGLHLGKVNRAQPFDQADFEVRMGSGVVRVEALWLDRRWRSSKRWLFFGLTEQGEWETRYLGDDVSVVVTNLAPRKSTSGRSPTYVQVTGRDDTEGSKKLKEALADRLQGN